MKRRRKSNKKNANTALAYINEKIDELVEIYNPIEFEKIKLHILHELDRMTKE